MILEAHCEVVPRSGCGQDVARIVRYDERSLLAILADGAGGTSGGRETATWVVDEIERLFAERRVNIETLRQAMLEVALEAERRDAGQTTLLAVSFSGTQMIGASVGPLAR